MEPLNYSEKSDYPVFIKDYLIKYATKNFPVNSHTLASELNLYFEPTSPATPLKVRSAINILRRQEIPVIANNRGYYISDDIGDINNQIESLQNRISAITLAIDGLKNCRIAISNNNI